ncbi:hypothetical protein D5266_02750 [bacterium c-19]|nr:hypothetical protein [bacterium c-19]
MKMKHKTIQNEPIKQLMIVVITVLFLCFLIAVLAYRPQSRAYKDAQSYLSELHNQNLDQIQADVEASELQLALSKATSEIEKNKIKFSGTVILGDSIVEGLSAYQLLNPTQAISARGKRSDNCADDIKKAAGLSPKRVILHYGMNDLEYCRGNEKLFITHYQSALKQVKKQMPKAKIYVHALLPIEASAIKQVSYYAKWKTFNQALKKLCEKENITFIDSGFLLKNKNDYESDGIHPKYAFYEKWLPHLIEVLK